MSLQFHMNTFWLYTFLRCFKMVKVNDFHVCRYFLSCNIFFSSMAFFIPARLHLQGYKWSATMNYWMVEFSYLLLENMGQCWRNDIGVCNSHNPPLSKRKGAIYNIVSAKRWLGYRKERIEPLSFFYTRNREKLPYTSILHNTVQRQCESSSKIMVIKTNHFLSENHHPAPPHLKIGRYSYKAASHHGRPYFTALPWLSHLPLEGL